MRNSIQRCPCVPGQIEICKCWFCRGRKTGVPGEKASKQGREPTTSLGDRCLPVSGLAVCSYKAIIKLKVERLENTRSPKTGDLQSKFSQNVLQRQKSWNLGSAVPSLVQFPCNLSERLS